MAERTIFEKIADGDAPSFKIWEDDNYVAFLSRWPNTPGFSVVIPKKNPGDNYLDVDDAVYTGLLLAAKKVAALLRKAFDVYRVALVFEGEGVAHLHIKLIPLHGVGQESGLHQHEPVFSATYQGFITTANGPELSDEELKEIQAKIKKAAA